MPEDIATKLLDEEVKKLKELLGTVASGEPDSKGIQKALENSAAAPTPVIEKTAQAPTVDSIRKVFKDRGYDWNESTDDYQMNIVAVRSKDSTVDVFNDTIYWIYWKDGVQVVDDAIITTEPGIYYLQNPLNPEGCAILACGQYKDAYGIRLHRGKYEALCQNGVVTVYRDGDKDNQYDYGALPRRGLYGINIHRAAPVGEVERIGKHSAGCQVFKNVEDFNAFMKVCRLRRKKYGNQFTYTLLHEDWFQ